jgi:pilus assembly protein CpaB
MKPKTIILMGVAVACGLVASYLTSRMLAQNNSTGDDEKVKVLVAKQKIPMGTRLKEPEKFFVEKEFTKGEEPKKAFTSYDQLKDKILNKTISAEVHVTPDDLMTAEQAGLGADIPPGWRGVSIQVKSDTVVAGFILPRSHVDVVFTTRGDTGPLSKTILQDVLVLAVDQKKAREGDGAAVPSSTVTLQVKLADAEKLSLAASLGELRLVLRGEGDNELIKTNGAKPPDVVKGSTPGASADDPGTGPSGPVTNGKIPDVPAAPAGSGQVVGKADSEPEVKTHTLTIYNGETPTKTVFVMGKDGQTTTRVEKSELEPAPKKEKEKEKEADKPKDSSDPEAKPAAKPEKETPEPAPKKDPQAAPSKRTGT